MFAYRCYLVLGWLGRSTIAYEDVYRPDCPAKLNLYIRNRTLTGAGLTDWVERPSPATLTEMSHLLGAPREIR